MIPKFGQLAIGLSILFGAGIQNYTHAETRTELLERYRNESMAIEVLRNSLDEATAKQGTIKLKMTQDALLILVTGGIALKLIQPNPNATYPRMPSLLVLSGVVFGAFALFEVGTGFYDGVELGVSEKDAALLKVALKSRQAEIQLIQSSLARTP